jgi:hypothetical protein
MLYLPPGRASNGDGGLPSALFDTDLSSRLDGQEGEGEGERDGQERVADKDAGAVQISFCLPQSSYATTFLALMSCE